MVIGMDYDKIVCNCFGTTVGDIKEAVDQGARTLDEVIEATGATTACGACTDEVERVVDYFASEKHL